VAHRELKETVYLYLPTYLTKDSTKSTDEHPDKEVHRVNEVHKIPAQELLYSWNGGAGVGGTPSFQHVNVFYKLEAV
jgi:hypothetical protein